MLHRYNPDRKSDHPRLHLAGFTAGLHADGYSGFDVLHDSSPVVEAACRVGGDVAAPTPHRPRRAVSPHPVPQRGKAHGRHRLADRDHPVEWPRSGSLAAPRARAYRRAPRQPRRTTAAVELRRCGRHTTRHPHSSLINVANAQIRGRHRTVTLGPHATRQHENSIWAPVCKTACPDFGNDG